MSVLRIARQELEDAVDEQESTELGWPGELHGDGVIVSVPLSHLAISFHLQSHLLILMSLLLLLLLLSSSSSSSSCSSSSSSSSCWKLPSHRRGGCERTLVRTRPAVGRRRRHYRPRLRVRGQRRQTLPSDF